MRILLASNNSKKRHELERILAGRGVEIVTPQALGIDLEPPETGATFEENCLIKARAFARLFAGPVLADDSGLEVDALGGAPGVRSARYAGPAASDAENRARLLAELAGVPDERRAARFVCCLALVKGGEVLARARGACAGRIIAAERGADGFGYDPIFLHEPSGRTFAELDPAEKDRVSHRGAALRELARRLDRIRKQAT
ncbi:MAG: RdgB/HAM1 family non-canonical purine NTP pyrophosphatase [Planctomycetes bacterium]|nr:RdgB/HAM1 family non-canonical purine NTP pyrophosphatase [Planctomycetota bacterium]